MTHMVIYLTGSPIVQYQKEKKLQPTKSAGPRSFIIKASLWLALVDFLLSRGGPVESIALYNVYVLVLYCFLQQLNITETVPFFVNIHFSADVEEISEDWNRSGCCKGRLPSP